MVNRNDLALFKCGLDLACSHAVGKIGDDKNGFKNTIFKTEEHLKIAGHVIMREIFACFFVKLIMHSLFH